tara:strand:+ start:522487 stop:522927 length:441 start_codon:yes stop_codon:yes gene_type:complete
MAFHIIEIVRTDFKTARPADELNSRMQRLLKMPHRYGPARLAIGRSLAIAPQPKLSTSFTGYGKAIKGENLFGIGEDLATWVTLIVEHAGNPDLDRADFQSLVAAHWSRGIYALWEDWRATAGDFDFFMAKLADRAGGRRLARASR